MNPGQQDIPTTAEALVAAISAQRDRRCWKKSSTTEAQFRAAVERFGDDNHAISAELDITISAINRRRVRLGLPRKMVWNAESKRRLLEMATRTPRPSTAELAEAFDATEGAIQTALSRFGITTASQGGKPRDLSHRRRGKCLRCREPFAAEHRHNFMCRACNEAIAEMAA